MAGHVETTEDGGGPPPRRRARPLPSHQRRRQLAEAAAVAFHRDGFHRVTVAGVASGIGVSAPAVYRHFRSKDELLAGAIETGLDEIDEALSRAARAGGGLAAVIDELATAALRRPDFWTLSQRESRHLSPSQRRAARRRFSTVTTTLGDAIGHARPDLPTGTRDLLVTAALAALATPATRTSPLPGPRLHAILVAATAALCAVDLPSPGPERRAPRPAAPADRPAALLAAAATLFHERGYAAVSLDDIGAAVGMAGPGIYHHFANKADLLVRAVERSPAPARRGEGDTASLARRDVELAVRERESVGIAVTEATELPADVAARIARRETEDVAAWSALVRRNRPSCGAHEATLLAQTARSVVQDVVRLGGHHRRAHVVDELTALTLAVLAVDVAALPGAA